jgi:cysteine-rich repeat protein
VRASLRGAALDSLVLVLVRTIVLACLAVGVGACSQLETFECGSSDQCMSDVVAGVCQADGWCSFPDEACGSGQRYGELAGDGLAGECVPADVDTEGPPDTNTSGTTSTTTSPVTSASIETGNDTQVVPDLGGADPFCGDGSVDPDEECDDADLVDDDECTNACTVPRCGDGIQQAEEGCDLGKLNDDRGACTSVCQAAVCGDGLVHAGFEQCDGTDLDGNDCTGLGYPGGGEPTCTPKCILDPSSCDACTMNGQQCNGFIPCDGMCENGSECFEAEAGVGTCLPPCMDDGECEAFAPTWPTYCLMTYCVIDCVMTQSCPTGMTCQDLMGIAEICLW